MSSLGYYRYKVDSVAAAGNTVIFYADGSPVKTCTIEPISTCYGKKIIKYLDRNGEYRFYPFLKSYEETDEPTSIGAVDNMVTSILNSKSSTKNVGYKTDRTLKLVSDPVSTEHLEILRDLFVSPRVYLYIGTTTDTENDWLLVTIRADKSIRKEAKSKFSIISLEVLLPEVYTISMI